MSAKHVVVDGSNIATEGRATPSLQQLDEAVRALIDQYSFETVTVVVDATFPNRIEKKERAVFESAIAAGEIITPPAGAIGRGDAFILQIADRANAVVLSNDSFQEFHGSHVWLFEPGRLIGGKPVPHVGWVFMERMPVRGVTSRKAITAAKKAAKRAPVPARPKVRAETPAKAAASPAGGSGSRRRARKASPKTSAPYNDALPFLEFVSAHQPGATVQGQVERFSSHGAYVVAEGVRCYVPLRNLGSPPPRSARAVLKVGESRPFVVQAIDAPRRGVDLGLPDVVPAPGPSSVRGGTAVEPVPTQQRQEERVTPAKKAAAKRPAKKSARKAAGRKTAAKKAPARKAARKTAAKRAPAKKAARKSTAKKATKKTAAKRTTKKAAAKRTAKKATARKATRKAAKKRAPAKKAARKSTAKKATRKKAAAKRAPAKKARKSTARKATKRTTRKR